MLPAITHTSWKSSQDLAWASTWSLELRYSPAHAMWINKRVDTAVQELGGGFGADKQEWLWVIAIAPDPALKMLSLLHINMHRRHHQDTWSFLVPGNITRVGLCWPYKQSLLMAIKVFLENEVLIMTNFQCQSRNTCGDQRAMNPSLGEDIRLKTVL